MTEQQPSPPPECKTEAAVEHYEAALKEAFPKGATGDVFHHWNEARKALEQPAQKCNYPYCGCDSKAWCKVERNAALDKKAENARELGLDYEPVAFFNPADPDARNAFSWPRRDRDPLHKEPLYTRPQAPEPVIDKSAAIRIATALGWEPKREPLTDEEIGALWNESSPSPNIFARAIEAAHGIMSVPDGKGDA